MLDHETAMENQSSPLKRTCGHVHAAGMDPYSFPILHIISPGLTLNTFSHLS